MTAAYEGIEGRLIFVAGAPGSKWSAVAHALSYADGINLTDRSDDREFGGVGKATHVGAYFGPGLEFGDQFTQLDGWSKDQLLEELIKPYADPSEGALLLKAHFFSRHLPFLAETFPAARFVLVHRPDGACLEWWLASGGFQISYPDYSWYQDEERMRKEIAVDNAGITEFVTSHGATLSRRRSMDPILAGLGLRYTPERVLDVATSAVEQRFGLGQGSAEEVLTRCHAAAKLASVAVVNRGG